MKLPTTNYKLFILRSFSERGQTKNGFTLVELLLVIAIIGILAGVYFAGMGNQRDRARGHAALKSISSALPYLAECHLQNGTVQAPANGGAICNLPTGMTYPTLGAGSTLGCGYTGGGGGAPIVVDCTAGTITCDYVNTANCTKAGF